MTLQVNCPYCSLLLNIDSATLKGPVQCCGCHHTFMVAGTPAPLPTVQARPVAPAPQAGLPGTQAPRAPGARAAAPPAKPSPRAPSPPGSRVGAERKASSASQDKEWMGYAMIAFLLLAGGGAIYAGLNWLSDFQAKAKRDEYALPKEVVDEQEARRKAWQESIRQQEADEAMAREQTVARLSQYVCGGNHAVASQLMIELEAVQQEIDSLRTDASSDNDPKDPAAFFKTSLAQHVSKNGVLFHWLGGKPPTFFGDLLFGTRAKPAERGQIADFLVAGNYSSTGTGFFISQDGWLLTCEHLLAGSTEVEFRDAKGAIRKARVVKTSPEQDMALLKAEGAGEAYLSLAPEDASMGSGVFTVGFPNTLVQGVEPKFTEGRVSSLSGIRDDRSLYQITVPLQPGNSGGPLVGMKNGSVVGVVSAILRREAGADNVGYAVKGSLASAFVKSVPEAPLPPFSGSDVADVEAMAARVRAAVVLILVQ